MNNNDTNTGTISHLVQTLRPCVNYLMRKKTDTESDSINLNIAIKSSPLMDSLTVKSFFTNPQMQSHCKTQNILKF